MKVIRSDRPCSASMLHCKLLFHCTTKPRKTRTGGAVSGMVGSDSVSGNGGYAGGRW
jgi:hypothetical protein